jgi:hypothetical protein
MLVFFSFSPSAGEAGRSLIRIHLIDLELGSFYLINLQFDGLRSESKHVRGASGDTTKVTSNGLTFVVLQQRYGLYFESGENTKTIKNPQHPPGDSARRRLLSVAYSCVIV